MWRERREGSLIVLLERVEGQIKPIYAELFRPIAVDTDLARDFGNLMSDPGSARDGLLLTTRVDSVPTGGVGSG